jgi:hypothetical protein
MFSMLVSFGLVRHLNRFLCSLTLAQKEYTFSLQSAQMLMVAKVKLGLTIQRAALLA